MKRLVSVFLLACTGLVAQYEHWVAGRLGARYIYRGYSTWVELRHYWHNKVFVFTVDPSTDRVTASGHTFTNGEQFKVTSSGTLPSAGGVPILPQNWYYACDVSGDTFKVVMAGDYTCSSADPPSRFDFTDAGSGTHKLGKQVTEWPSHDVYLALSGVPSGVSYEVYCGAALCSVTQGKAKSVWGNAPYYIKFTASPTATLGVATITATVSVDGEPDETVNLPLTVETLTPIPSVRPASYPAIPNLATWESTMQVLARTWCDPTSYATAASSIGSLAYGLESQVWYYDGAWVYRQIARYAGYANWNNCADYIGNWYLGEVLRMKGGLLGYRSFTDGLKSGCASCDMRNRVAIALLSGSQAFWYTAGEPWDLYIRETAYILETFISLQQVTGAANPKVQKSAEHLLAMFDELFRDDTWTMHQIFYDGLALRALIKYWDMTSDPRVPVAIKTALDWIWTNAWNNTTKKMAYNPANRGARCIAGCADDPETWNWTELIPLTLPAFGWYYWYSGDDTYRQRGDEIFKALPRWPSFTATAADDRVTVPAHGLAVGDPVLVIRHPGGSALPAGFTHYTSMYVNSVVDANTITLSWTKGGSTVNITSDGVGAMGWKCTGSGCRGRDSGKMFSQQFRWGMAYVQWRQGQAPYTP